jgi:uncharacterized membrane protein
VYTIENLFKLLHVLAVIVWVGGVLTVNVLQVLVGGGRDRAARGSLLRLGDLYGRAVIAPAAALTLVTGIVRVEQIDVGYGTFWVVWGLAAVVGSLVLGATMIRATNVELGRLAGERHPPGGRPQRRHAVGKGGHAQRPTEVAAQPERGLPTATATASPPLDPPGVRVGSQGLRVAACRLESVCQRSSRSGRLVRAIGIAPAARNRATAGASAAATCPANARTLGWWGCRPGRGSP